MQNRPVEKPHTDGDADNLPDSANPKPDTQTQTPTRTTTTTPDRSREGQQNPQSR